MESLKNKTHRTEWTTATELPVPLYSATAVVKNYKAYVAGFSGPRKEARYKVYVYDIYTDHWSHLPNPDVNLATHEIIGRMLTLVGGRQNSDNKWSKRLLSFDESSGSWIRYFPDMLVARSRCSVVIHKSNVIVAGGTTTNNECLSSIEVMNVTDHKLFWKKVATHLPFPMWNMSATICNDEMFIIGCAHYKWRYGKAYKLAVSSIVNSLFVEVCSWKELYMPSTAATTTIVPYSSPPMIVGGSKTSGSFDSITDIHVYNAATRTWEVVGKLNTGRAYSVVAAVDKKAIIVIGGCSRAKSFDECTASSMKTVEIGQVVAI